MREALSRLNEKRIVAFSAVAAVVVVGLLVVAVLVAVGGGSNAADEDRTPTPPATNTAAATNTSTPGATPTASPTPFTHFGILDGTPMTDAEWAARKDLLPLAVMLDNTSNANPHSGLDKADIVYEAFVEGGITRLMAVYWRQAADVVEPVRSARTPFAVWVSELGALYGHAGGAETDGDANAIGQIAEWGVPDLNAFSPGSNTAYYRDNERYAPYNLATSTEALRKAANALGFNGKPTVSSWLFRDPGATAPKGKPAGGVEVDFQGHLYSWQYIQWKWDPATKRYLRFQFGGPQVDAVTGDQLAFATVIVMTAPAKVADENGHVLYEQFGTGPATVFTGGQAFEGSWTKDDRESRTRFHDLSGREISFERGPIFIEVLSTQSSFSYVATAGDLPELPKFVPAPPAPPEVDEPTATPTETPAPETPTASPTSKAAPSSSPSATQSPGGTGTAEASSTSTSETETPRASATGTQDTPGPASATAEPSP
ncbi:MAG: DUF3048 domain-containing protein [Dehalococcoidia bacterium]